MRTVFEQEGIPVELRGNRPLLLDDGDSVWFVGRGKVDVFAGRTEDGEVVGARRHVLRMETGDVLLGMDPDGSERNLKLLAICIAGTRLYRLDLARFRDLATDSAFSKAVSDAVEQWVWELPAGKIDHQEPHIETAQRELEEEAGVQANDWHELGAMISSPGVFDELVYLYLAKDLKEVEQQPEEHEVFELHWIDFDEALDWAVTGKINDAKTVIALFRASQYLASNSMK